MRAFSFPDTSMGIRKACTSPRAGRTQCAYQTFGTAILGSNPRMGLVLPVGAEPGDNNTTQTYFFLIQNAGDLAGVFDLVFQFEQF